MSSTPATEAPDRTKSPKAVSRPGDRIFRGLSIGSGAVILLILVGVTVFLVAGASGAITADPSAVRGGEGLVAYIGPLIFGTLLSAVIALIIALPLSIGIALFISHYAPRKLATGLGYIVDLLAAVPSIIFGLWGMQIASDAVPVFDFLFEHLGFIPLFGGESVTTTGRTMLMIGIVLATPIGVMAGTYLAEYGRGGLPGPRRDPVGDDPPDRHPLRHLGGDVGGDARSRPCPR